MRLELLERNRTTVKKLQALTFSICRETVLYFIVQLCWKLTLEQNSWRCYMSMNISFFLWYQCDYCSQVHSLFFYRESGIHSVKSKFQDCLLLRYLRRCSYRPRPCKQSLKPLIRKRRLYS